MMLTGPELERMRRRMAQATRTCHLPDGRKFRVSTKRRFVVVYDYGDLKSLPFVQIEYRTDSLERAIVYRSRQGAGFDDKGIARRFLVDTGRDRVRLGVDEWTDARA